MKNYIENNKKSDLIPNPNEVTHTQVSETYERINYTNCLQEKSIELQELKSFIQAIISQAESLEQWRQCENNNQRLAQGIDDGIKRLIDLLYILLRSYNKTLFCMMVCQIKCNTSC